MVAEGKGKCYTSYDDVVSFVGRFQGFMVPVFVPIDNTLVVDDLAEINIAQLPALLATWIWSKRLRN